MNKEKNLDHFMALNYDVVMRRKKDDFYMFIPELSIIAYGKSAGEAYENLLTEKEKFFNNIIEFDLEETVNEPAKVKIKKKQYHELLQFALKIFIIFFLFIIIFAVLFLPMYASFEKTVNHTLSTVPEKVVSGVFLKIEDKLNSMTEKDKEQARLKIRNVVNDLKPYADEIKVLFTDGEKGTKRPVSERSKVDVGSTVKNAGK
jgi:hypothetical protein